MNRNELIARALANHALIRYAKEKGYVLLKAHVEGNAIVYTGVPEKRDPELEILLDIGGIPKVVDIREPIVTNHSPLAVEYITSETDR